MFENEAIKAGYDRQTVDELLFMRKKEMLDEELEFIKTLNLATTEEYDKTLNARLKMIEAEVKRLEKAKTEKINIAKKEAFFMNSIYDELVKRAQKEEEERQKRLEESIKKTQEALRQLIQTMQEVNNTKIENIDAEIAQRQTEKSAHETRISEMKELAREGVLTAEESIKAEEVQVAKLESDIQALEKKKQKLLTINLGLQTALNLAESGDPNAIGSSLNSVGDFINKLGSFKEGTDRTGSGNIDNDGGHLAILHPDEMVFQKELADPLRQRGLDRFDATNLAIQKHDEMTNRAALMNGSFSDIMTLAMLNDISMKQDSIVKAINSIEIPEYKQDYNVLEQAFIQTIKTNNELKRYINYIR
jgi:chromosome segregation ATPase